MMSRIVLGTIMVVGALSMTGCGLPVAPLAGAIYTDVKFGDTATSATSASKEGRACATSILGLVATGDASVAAAKENGGIKEVSSVDHKGFSILGLYAELCTVVKGG